MRKAALLALALGLTACGGDNYGGGPIDPGSGKRPAVSFAKPLPRSLPATIKIPKLGVTAPVSELGLQSNGRIQEPPLTQPNLAGWWKNGPTPGEGGPSVILGHVDARGKRAVFHRLRDLRPGDRVQVTRRDGTTATFAVQKVENVSKDSFPGEKIYAEDLDYAALRLVTCGGTFDTTRGHYSDNVIAYARLVRA
ncbi:class F sortase [Actinomadura rudentiformis]|uniref:class F sortase n=1 Tax=Actinomadura rudentiformis TaxID=359158 RepID=UPI001CEF5E45|nr:class F sortase [Actinomadura rudentiformis]